MSDVNIYNLGNHLVNRYLIVSETHRILIDSGYPNSLNELGKLLRPTNFKIQDINFLICTHFHVDHAGAAQELKNFGVKLIVFEHQIEAIKEMETLASQKFNYTPILQDNLIMLVNESEQFLNTLHIDGQVLLTDGHTKDSISVVLKSGEVFTGDLYNENAIADDDIPSKRSWEIIKQHGGKIVYPGHGDIYNI